jgi:hypothetical protein
MQSEFGVCSACKYVPEINNATAVDRAVHKVLDALFDRLVYQSDSLASLIVVSRIGFKHEIEKHLMEKAKGTDMQWTILRPVAFFENFTPDYF